MDGGSKRGGFLFASVIGEHAQPKDPKARKVIRTHVMRNYLDNNDDVPKEDKGTKAPTAVEGLGLGQKLRFRLKPDSLEQSIPIRLRTKSKAGKINQEGGVRKRKSAAKENAVPDVGSGFVYEFSITREGAPAKTRQALIDADVQPYIHDDSGQDVEQVLPLAWDADISTPQSPLLEVSDPFKSYDVLPTSPLRWFGNSRIDPLNVLPIELSPFDETLVDRFQNYTPDSWCPVSAQTAWFPFAINDQLLFHATMYNWIMHFADVNKGFLEANPGITRHKLTAIHMINERLSDPVEAIKDESLGAVVAVVNAEIAYGSPQDSAKHMAGLQAMVLLRGGIETLADGIGGLLQRLVGWTDLNYAELSGESLKFTKQDCEWDKARAETCNHCFRTSEPEIQTTQSSDALTKQSQVIPLLRETRQLCEEVAQRPLSSLTEREKMNRSDRFHALERRLRIATEASRDSVADVGTRKNEMIWRSCASAGLLYVHHVLRGLPLNYRQFDTLCQDLMWTLMELEDTEQAWNFAPELLIWVLSVGSLLTIHRPQRQWFVDSLARACLTFRYVEWSQYREALRGFLWVETVDDDRYLSIWQDVEVLVTIGDIGEGSFAALLESNGGF